MAVVITVAVLAVLAALVVALAVAAALMWELRVAHRRRNRAIRTAARRLARGGAVAGRSDVQVEREPGGREFWEPLNDPAPTFIDRWSLSAEPDTSSPFDITGEQDG